MKRTSLPKRSVWWTAGLAAGAVAALLCVTAWAAPVKDPDKAPAKEPAKAPTKEKAKETG